MVKLISSRWAIFWQCFKLLGHFKISRCWTPFHSWPCTGIHLHWFSPFLMQLELQWVQQEQKSIHKSSFSNIYLLLTCAKERFESDYVEARKSLHFFPHPQVIQKPSGKTSNRPYLFSQTFISVDPRLSYIRIFYFGRHRLSILSSMKSMY